MYIEQNKSYNEKILELPETLERLSIVGPKILVRLEKYEQETTTASGLLRTKQKARHTEAGQIKAEKDDTWKAEYSPKGVIVMEPNKMASKVLDEDFGISLKKGDKVWISPRVTENMGHYIFRHQRDSSIFDFDGFILIHPTQIEGIYEEAQ